MSKAELDSERLRWILDNATRMSEPLYIAGTTKPAGHRVSLVFDVGGVAPWATQDALIAAIDIERMKV